MVSDFADNRVVLSVIQVHRKNHRINVQHRSAEV